jgi:hypothetical protein
MRAYGSKGTFDIIAVPPSESLDTKALLIQCKRRDYLPAEEEAHMLIVGKSLAARVMLATVDGNNKIVFKEYRYAPGKAY